MQAYLQIYVICVRAPAHLNLRQEHYSGSLWPFVGHLAVLTEYKNVSKRTHQYQNQEDIMKEATISPPPPKKKKNTLPRQLY